MAKVLLVGNFRPSLPLLRTLTQAGHAVACGVDRASPYLFASRHAAECVLHAKLDERRETALEQIRTYLAADGAVDALIPVNDSAMRLISSNRDAMPSHVALILPSPEIIDLCTAKEAMFDLCAELGVAVAPRRLARDRAELAAAVEAVGMPCIVKPVDDRAPLFGRKAVVLRCGRSLEAAVPSWPREHARLCVQRYVEGPRHNLVFAAQRGRLIGAVEFRSVRTDRSDATGYSTAVESVRPTPSIQGATDALLRRLNYSGVGMLQFIIDRETGESSFLELNPRLGGTSGAAEACGLPICRLMLEIGLGRAVEPRSDPWAYPLNRRVVWTRGDLAGLANEWRRGALSARSAAAWALAAARDAFGRHHLTLDPSDLAPTVLGFVHPPLARLGLWRDLFVGGEDRRALEQPGSPPIVRIKAARSGPTASPRPALASSQAI